LAYQISKQSPFDDQNYPQMKCAASILAIFFLSFVSVYGEEGEWRQMPEILSRIIPPVFPDRDFIITNYGAIADGKTDCTAAIGRAIAACATSGGGRVVIPAGAFLCGVI
jgi:hypothetical protein